MISKEYKFQTDAVQAAKNKSKIICFVQKYFFLCQNCVLLERCDAKLCCKNGHMLQKSILCCKK